MPNALEKLMKRLKSAFNMTAFGSDSEVSLMGNGYRWKYLPGTELNWDSLAGDLWLIPGAQSCYAWITRNWLQAPIEVQNRVGNEWQPVPNHVLTNLLLHPNPQYDYSTLLQGVLLSWFFDGNAYIGIEYGGGRLPVELWYLPHFAITVRRDKQTGETYYDYRNGQSQIRLDASQVIHLRNGIDPRNPMYGLSPLASATRDAYAMQQDSTYRAKSMKNTGILPSVISPDLKDTQSIADLQFDPEAFLEVLRAKAQGDRAGEPAVWNLPLKYERIGLTPAELLMETYADRPESIICSLFGIPSQAVGLHVGRLSKTYANYQEARESAWEDCILPNMKIISNQLGEKLLPMLSFRPQTERINFDVKSIRPLQPDLDKLHDRTRKDWQASLIDRATWKLQTGQIPLPEDVGVYYQDVAVKVAPEPTQERDGVSKND